MPTEPRTVRFNRQTFKVLGDRRIRGEDYLVVGHYGNGERSREHVLQVLGKHRHKEKVIHCLKNSKNNWRRINHLDRIQGSHLPFAGITSIGKSGNELFVVMEHIRGKSLRHNLRMEKRLTAYQAIRLYSQLVRQLCNLYRTTGIIHGDIAPENLIVSPQGTRLVLIDFGSSFRFTDSQNKDKGDGGRAIYQSPSQLAGKPATRLCEQFSAASVFYEMLTRKMPFNVVEKTEPRCRNSLIKPPSENATEISDLPSRVWQAVDEHVSRAASLKPESRFATINEWQESANNLRDYSNRPELAPELKTGIVSSLIKSLFGRGED